METASPTINGGDGGHGPCECQQSAALLMTEIDQTLGGLLPDTASFSASSSLRPARQSQQQQPLFLDNALLLGRRLALEWERLNGCANAEEHLGPAAFRSTAKAIERLLELYEVLLESACPRNVATAARPAAVVAEQDPSSSTWPPQVGRVPITLGSLELDGEESRMVVQEALRHTFVRLGDILKDLEDESKQVMVNGVPEDVKRAQALMFRLLGRIPR